MTLPPYIAIAGVCLMLFYILVDNFFESFSKRFRSILDILLYFGLLLWSISTITIILLSGINIWTILISSWIFGVVIYNVYRPLYKKYRLSKSPKKFYIHKVELRYVPAHKLKTNETSYSIIVYRTDDLINWEGKMFRKCYKTHVRNFGNTLAVLNKMCKRGAKVLFYSYFEEFDITYNVDY